jgi:hypothetical protein
MRTQPLPLALWILSSVVAGACTSILISSLSKLANYGAKVPPRPRRFDPEQRTEYPPNKASANQSQDRQVDDWETSKQQDDWDFGENSQPKSPSSGSSSTYSFGYQDPKNTAVGKTESIYDADYRVIIPPYKQPDTESTDEDDWDFFAEDKE